MNDESKNYGPVLTCEFGPYISRKRASEVLTRLNSVARSSYHERNAQNQKRINKRMFGGDCCSKYMYFQKNVAKKKKSNSIQELKFN